MACIGTIEFDFLNPVELMVDMEKRFEKGQLRRVIDYIALLKENANDIARFKVQRLKNTFESIMEQALKANETNLFHRDLRDILKLFISEDTEH